MKQLVLLVFFQMKDSTIKFFTHFSIEFGKTNYQIGFEEKHDW